MKKSSFYILLILLISCSHNQQKFNINQWKHIDGSYNHRDLMYIDLIENVLYKGMKYKEVEKLLGKPNEHKFNQQISYELYFDFNNEETKELQIYFSKDSTLINTVRKIRFS
jgi:hypothetical protein